MTALRSVSNEVSTFEETQDISSPSSVVDPQFCSYEQSVSGNGESDSKNENFSQISKENYEPFEQVLEFDSPKASHENSSNSENEFSVEDEGYFPKTKGIKVSISSCLENVIDSIFNDFIHRELVIHFEIMIEQQKILSEIKCDVEDEAQLDSSYVDLELGGSSAPSLLETTKFVSKNEDGFESTTKSATIYEDQAFQTDGYDSPESGDNLEKSSDFLTPPSSIKDPLDAVDFELPESVYNVDDNSDSPTEPAKKFQFVNPVQPKFDFSHEDECKPSPKSNEFRPSEIVTTDGIDDRIESQSFESKSSGKTFTLPSESIENHLKRSSSEDSIENSYFSALAKKSILSSPEDSQSSDFSMVQVTDSFKRSCPDEHGYSKKFKSGRVVS